MPTENEKILVTLEEIWDQWCEQAAEKAGITVEELKRRLEDDEASLAVTAIITPPVGDK